MSSSNQAPEPSMDEILASIRRIISEDDAPAGQVPEAASGPSSAGAAPLAAAGPQGAGAPAAAVPPGQPSAPVAHIHGAPPAAGPAAAPPVPGPAPQVHEPQAYPENGAQLPADEADGMAEDHDAAFHLDPAHMVPDAAASEPAEDEQAVFNLSEDFIDTGPDVVDASQPGQPAEAEMVQPEAGRGADWPAAAETAPEVAPAPAPEDTLPGQGGRGEPEMPDEAAEDGRSGFARMIGFVPKAKRTAAAQPSEKAAVQMDGEGAPQVAVSQAAPETGRASEEAGGAPVPLSATAGGTQVERDGPAATATNGAEVSSVAPTAPELVVVADRDRQEPPADEAETVGAATEEPVAARTTDEGAAARPETASLEDNLRALLRPIVREWLDANMPRILESVVREELAAADEKPPVS